MSFKLIWDRQALGHLKEILTYLENQRPCVFKQIKNRTLRASVGRKNKGLNLSTFCYIKDSKRDAFILMNEETEQEFEKKLVRVYTLNSEIIITESFSQ